VFEVVLIHPEIPPNTGNVIRLCANAGCHLHLVEPLGFELSDYHLRRAGMDYAELAVVTTHRDWASCRAVLLAEQPERRLFAFTTRGSRRLASADFRAGDVFVFGCETSGLPEDIRAEFDPEHRLRLPMVPGNRSINLSNAVAITVFEAWRQLGYPGGE
jgi:tRNA (cytidine/uridine-2'-O-)-methyltransferase